jgi:hypothetical protein
MSTAIEILQQSYQQLAVRDQSFAQSLLSQFESKGCLSVKQSEWVEILAKRVSQPAEPRQVTELGSFTAVIELFKASKMSYPTIVLALADKSPLELKVAGAKSKAPGCVNLTNGGKWGVDNVWYGRVTPEGKWEPTGKAETKASEITALLQKLAANPARTAAEHGRLSGKCCFCNLKLSADDSTGAGYGPTCAARWGMPYGKKKGA